jgi:hypothetical protein
MNVSRENILRRFDETGHRKIGTLHFEWQFMYSNHIYYMYRFLSYYSVEFILICFFHWTHNHYMTYFFWMVILTTKTTTLINRDVFKPIMEFHSPSGYFWSPCYS